ncbi:MAG: S9 family peptidase [Arenimonas sp.]|nr:S9 family peptidase [Arenimonas sp.]
MTSRVLVVLWLALATMPLAAAEPAPAVDVSVYSRTDDFNSLQISPSGEFYVAVVPRDASSTLVFLRRSDNSVAWVMESVDRRYIHSVDWVSDRRVVYTYARSSGDRDTPLRMPGLYGVNVDGSERRELFGMDVADFINTYMGRGIRGRRSTARAVARVENNAWLVGTLPEDPTRVIVEVHDGDDKTPVSVEWLDVSDGKRELIAASPVDRANFLVDASGELRFALGAGDDNVQKLFHRQGAGAPWALVNDPAASGRVEVPIGFAADNRTAFFTSDHATQPDAVVAYDTRTGTRREVMRDAIVDPAAVIPALGNPAVLAGVFFDGPMPATRFIEPASEDARLQRVLEQAFAGMRVTVTSSTRDGKLAVVLVTGPGSPGDFYLFDTTAKTATYAVARRAWYDPDTSATVRPVRLEARDGLALHGFLTTPKGSDGKGLPMVVMPHGGPFGIHDSLVFDADAQLLAAAGYAVLQVNFRGSGNYGRGFREAGARQWGRRMQDDLTDATRWAILGGIADESRICIYGASYGGYAALMGVAREPDLYRCAVGYVGVYDLQQLTTFSRRTPQYHEAWMSDWVGERRSLGSVSPVNLAANIKVPVMLAAGGMDPVAPVFHTEAMEKALRKAGVPVETLYYPNEGHGFHAPEHREQFYRQLLGFLSRHLGGSQAAAARPAP